MSTVNMLVLVEVVARCRERAAAGGCPLVVLDLDLTAWWPQERVRAALRHLERAEGLRGLSELTDGCLPGLFIGAWADFVARHELAARWPRVPWPQLEAEFRSALAWTPRALRSDVLADGLPGFAAAVAAAGGRLVAVTGRPQWLQGTSAQQLRAAGLAGVEVVVAPRLSGRSTAEGKAATPLPGVDDVDVVAAVDDCRANRQALRRRWPGALVCAVSAPGFASDAQLDEPSVSSFRLSGVDQLGVVAAGVLA